MHEPPDFTEYAAERSPRLFKTAFLLCRDSGQAEDLLQVTLLKAWRVWRRIEGDPDPYVHRILVNAHLSARRRLWRREVVVDALPEIAQDDGLRALDTRTALVDAMARLPRRQRAVIVLRFFEDLTEAQTAAAMGCSVGTVKSQTSRALATLRIDPRLLDVHPTGKRI
ncbi:SigE family RNA polymerase sigma factor [Actinocorallia lasiicapitis]